MRNDPYRNFRYRLEIEGVQMAAFSEAVIPNSSVEVISYRPGNDPTRERKLSGLTKNENFTLKHGITDSMELYTWYKQVTETGAQDKRKNVSVILIDEAGEDKSRWDIVEAWPCKYSTSDLDAKGNQVLIESFEFAHEGVTRVQ